MYGTFEINEEIWQQANVDKTANSRKFIEENIVNSFKISNWVGGITVRGNDKYFPELRQHM